MFVLHRVSINGKESKTEPQQKLTWLVLLS